MTMRGKIFPVPGDKMVHLVTHFVWKEQWSEVKMGSSQWLGREGYKIRYKEF